MADISKASSWWLAVAAGVLASAPAAHAADPAGGHPLPGIAHLVIIYEENHSFDNLYGGWEGVEGPGNAAPAARTQVAQDGSPFGCLPQTDPGLTSPVPLPVTCTDQAHHIESAFTNGPYAIERFIPADAKTCAGGQPGGCTSDLVHRFYQAQYQMHHGRMDRFVTGSDVLGLTMGLYDTQTLPIYQYLHAPGHPRYVIADHFFQAAFGGSFLNHQWLVAAATPVFPGAPADGSKADLHSLLDSNGMPARYPFYAPTGDVKDAMLTAKCDGPAKALRLACGDYAVNTAQPTYQPYAPGTPDFAHLPPQTNRTIGDELNSAGIDWAWYSGGWSNASGAVGAPGWTNGDGSSCTDPQTIPGATAPYCPDRLFQFHHQPFNYYASFDPATPAGKANRAAHLRDEAEFIALTAAEQTDCKLKPVSFVKPGGANNEHPGYASVHTGSAHLVELIRGILAGSCAADTAIIVTYDEFGGQWDHVPPPGQAKVKGPHDQWGPGNRIPALLISPRLSAQSAVDHTQYDTTSILATIERRYGLKPLSSRDARVKDLAPVLTGHIPVSGKGVAENNGRTERR